MNRNFLPKINSFTKFYCQNQLFSNKISGIVGILRPDLILVQPFPTAHNNNKNILTLDK